MTVETGIFYLNKLRGKGGGLRGYQEMRGEGKSGLKWMPELEFQKRTGL